MVITPKRNREFRVIGIVEVIWKAVAGVVNRRIGVAVNFHDVLHGLRVGRGTGTAFLETRIIHQLAAMREEVLIWKDYNALDMEFCLKIFVGYGIRIRTQRVVWIY